MHAAVVRDQTTKSVAEEGGGREVNRIKGPQACRLENSGGFKDFATDPNELNSAKNVPCPGNKILAQCHNCPCHFSSGKSTANQ